MLSPDKAEGSASSVRDAGIRLIGIVWHNRAQLYSVVAKQEMQYPTAMIMIDDR